MQHHELTDAELIAEARELLLEISRRTLSQAPSTYSEANPYYQDKSEDKHRQHLASALAILSRVLINPMEDPAYSLEDSISDYEDQLSYLLMVQEIRSSTEQNKNNQFLIFARLAAAGYLPPPAYSQLISEMLSNYTSRTCRYFGEGVLPEYKKNIVGKQKTERKDYDLYMTFEKLRKEDPPTYPYSMTGYKNASKTLGYTSSACLSSQIRHAVEKFKKIYGSYDPPPY